MLKLPYRWRNTCPALIVRNLLAGAPKSSHPTIARALVVASCLLWGETDDLYKDTKIDTSNEMIRIGTFEIYIVWPLDDRLMDLLNPPIPQWANVYAICPPQTNRLLRQLDCDEGKRVRLFTIDEYIKSRLLHARITTLWPIEAVIHRFFELYNMTINKRHWPAPRKLVQVI
ncbi:MAG: hypothetical protein NTW19_08590 [Planctomycetota bacterium]|nr:hypothetical protein [Planctomycetota bacterium]